MRINHPGHRGTKLGMMTINLGHRGAKLGNGMMTINPGHRGGKRGMMRKPGATGRLRVVVNLQRAPRASQKTTCFFQEDI